MISIDVVIISNINDLNQLLVCLKSISLYGKDIFSAIKIVVQGDKEDFFKLRNIIKSVNSYNLHNIEIYPQSLFVMNTLNLNGWQIQQILKISCSRFSSSQASLILDTKHIFLKEIRLVNYYENGKYKMPIGSQSIHIDKSRGDCFINSHNLFGLDWRKYIDKTLPTVTPYIFDTNIINEMCDFIESNNSKLNFEEYFIHNIAKYTEFYLYAAFLQKIGKFEDLYIAINNFNPILWGTENLEELDFLKILNTNSLQSIGLHRNFLRKHKNDLIEKIAKPFFLNLGITEFTSII